MARKGRKDRYGLDWFLTNQSVAFAQTFERGGPRVAFKWVACDEKDQVGVFWPCEFGPVPAAVHSFTLDDHLQWYRYLLTLTPDFLDDDCQVDLPNLGFYFFSLENQESYCGDGYMCLGAPAHPITVDELPEQFRPLIQATRFPGTFCPSTVLYAAKVWRTV